MKHYTEDYELGYERGRRDALRRLNESAKSDGIDNYVHVTYDYLSLLKKLKAEFSKIAKGTEYVILPQSQTNESRFKDNETDNRLLKFDIMSKDEEKLFNTISIEFASASKVKVEVITYGNRGISDKETELFDTIHGIISFIKKNYL